MTKSKSLNLEIFETSDGAKLLLEDFGGHGDSLLFVHATGFCARMHLSIAKLLRERFHCYGLNTRFHGGSTGGATADYRWDTLGADIIEVVSSLPSKAWHGFGHSYGGAGLLLAEESKPGTFEALFLYEPVVIIEDRSPLPNYNSPLSIRTRQRRQSFATRLEAATNFSSKKPMNGFDALTFDLYLETGLTRGYDSQVHLSCPSEIESEIYAYANCHNAFDNLDKIKARTLFVAGEMTTDFNIEYMEQLASRCLDAETQIATGLGHFGPFENPRAIASMMEQFFSPSGR